MKKIWVVIASGVLTQATSGVDYRI